MMSLDSISRRVFFRRICPLCTIMACAIQSLLPIGAAAQAPGDPPALTLRTACLDVAACRTNPRSTTRSPFRATILPRRRSRSFLRCTSGSETETRPAPAGTWCRSSSVRRSPNSAPSSSRRIRCEAIGARPENEKAVNALLDMVMAHYAIDKKKVAVTGYSMGGTGSWHFAEKFPERFSAAIPVAGRPPASASGWRLPVLAIHSRDDQVAPFDPTQARIAELQKAGVNAKLIALTGITHYETSRFRDALRQAIPWLREVWK